MEKQGPEFAEVRQAVEAAQYAQPANVDQPPQQPFAGSNDLPGKLAELAGLHQQGVLSDEEFEQAKQRLLRG